MDSDERLENPEERHTVPDWHVSRTEWKPIAYSSPVPAQESAHAPVYATPPTTPPAAVDAEPPYDVRTPVCNKAEPGAQWPAGSRDAVTDRLQAASISESFLSGSAAGASQTGLFPFAFQAHKRQPSQPETPSEASDDCADSVWSVQSVRGSPAPPGGRFVVDTPGAESVNGNGNGKRPDPVEMMMFKKGVEQAQHAERAQATAPAPESQWLDIEDDEMAAESEDGAQKGPLGRSYTD